MDTNEDLKGPRVLSPPVEVRNPAGNVYLAVKFLAENDEFKLYECTREDGSQAILKIAAIPENNEILDREAYVLQILRERAEHVEEAYTKVKGDSDRRMNYQFCFPELIDSFIGDASQDGRRINILGFSEISDRLDDLVPLLHVRQKGLLRDNMRIDPKTSAWILGKLLKLLVFTHSQYIAAGFLTGDNILINREQHYVALFDWSRAVINDGCLRISVIAEEISTVAREVILALGGDPETGELPEDEQLKDGRYQEFIWNLVSGAEFDVNEVHREFYKLVDDLWPEGGFHPFTGYLLD